MGAIERLTITLPADMAGLVKGAVDEGDYATASEVIREALRDWKMKRELRLYHIAELKAEIDRGVRERRKIELLISMRSELLHGGGSYSLTA